LKKHSFQRFASTMVVFDRNMKRIQKDKAALAPNSRDFDYLKEEVATRLVDRLEDISSHRFPVALDLGGQCGYLTKHLQQSKAQIQILYQSDISVKSLMRDNVVDQKNNFRLKPIKIVADEEFIPFKENSLDLVISNMSLHWVNDLPGTFAQIKKVLKEDGLFLASMFGESTLMELRNSFAKTEQEREGGFSPHVSPFAGVSDIGNLLTKAGFSLPTVDTEVLSVNFRDAFILMRDLKGMGENNATLSRRKFTPKETIFGVGDVYKTHYGNPDGSVPATFQVVYMVGWKPHSSQPSAKRRGSATSSMKALGKTGNELR